MNKFLYYKTRVLFERDLPQITQSVVKPIVFIEDTKEMWTCGNYFNIGFPSLVVSEKDTVVTISMGDSKVDMMTSGSGLRIAKGEGNSIIFTSSALTAIKTSGPLTWVPESKTLEHDFSGALAGTVGPSSDDTNVSIVSIPQLSVDKYGHVTSADTKRLIIRDYVEQLAPTELLGERNVLLSYEEAKNDKDIAGVRKSNGMTFNDALKKLTVQGGIISNGEVLVNNSDLKVVGGKIIGNLEGDVTGSAKPKIHASEIGEYGGASLSLIGHVKVSDTLPLSAPSVSSDNTSPENATIETVAATPLMVWRALQASKEYTNDNKTILIAKDINNSNITLPNTVTFGRDFIYDKNELSIRWIEIKD